MKNSTKSLLLTFQRSFVVVAVFGSVTGGSFAQTILFNNGAQVYTASAAIVKVNGGFQNDGASAVFENNGTMTISNSGTPGSVFLKNSSLVQGNGTYLVEQDWTNDATFTAGNSTVNFNGNLQEFITSTNNTVTTFNNLILSGTGTSANRKKTLQLVNAIISTTGTLTINDRELETLTNTMFVLNPSTSCINNTTIVGSEGFVSSSVGGSLSRATNTSSVYLYPTGSSVGTTRYRPAKLTPASTATNTYTARLGNNDATVDGFNTASLDTNMCTVNPLFYHQINRSTGTDNASIDIFYNQTADGGWDGLAQWNTPTAALWNSMGTVVATSAVPFNDVLKVNWTDFSNSPYILSRKKPAMPVLACAPVCQNSTGNSFSASGTGSIFTWTSPVGTTISSGQGTNSVTIDWGSSSGSVSVTTSSAFGCVSSPASCPVTVFTPPVAAFDTLATSGFTYNFSDQSSGGATDWLWNFGDGSTSTMQNPTHAYSDNGIENVCLYTQNSNGCADTICRSYDVTLVEYVIIPNVFTPDGDGINDFYFITNSGLKEYKLEIFNRWGLKIFESEIASIKWDGRTTAGVKCTDGTYYFILKAVSQTKKDYSTTGFIQLLNNKN